MHPDIPLLLTATFPALVDTDIELPWDHTFHVQNCTAHHDILHISCVLDATISIVLEYDTVSRILKLVQTSGAVDVDVVSRASYEAMRPLYEYEGGAHPEEACVVGLTGPAKTDACFLPTFGCAGPWIPYILQNILLPVEGLRVQLPSVAHL